MKSFLITIIVIFGFIGAVQAKYMTVEAVITKEGESYLVTHRSSDKPISINEFIAYLKNLRNRSAIGLKIISAESVPIPKIQTILTGASENPLIEILDIRLGSSGKRELELKQERTIEEQIDELIDPVLREMRDSTEQPEKKQNKMATPRKLSD